MIEKLKRLYNNLDIDYNKVQLYYKNLTEIEDWYYKQLIEIYQENEDLSTDTVIEECHGEHTFTNYTTKSLNKIDNFIEELNKMIEDDKNTNYSNNSSPN
jgi:hypothetical protein